MPSYITVAQEANSELIVKRSRFIGYVKPVTTGQQAIDFINEIRARHRDATHNVYAYSVREDNLRRYSDDGEPQGTAGMPVLDALQKRGIIDCCVVVTRYFGGVLLGTGGLVHAYSTSATAAIDAGVPSTMGLCSCLEIVCDYNLYGKLVSLVPQEGGVVENTVFAEDVNMQLYLPVELVAGFSEKLTDISAGRVSAVHVGEKYVRLK